ncbi:MAG: hypothetical protein KDD68_03585 [Bdellovibrionales bacterium]|nr:hypothetical protein [Bdellovibrionales bacterium]
MLVVGLVWLIASCVSAKKWPPSENGQPLEWSYPQSVGPFEMSPRGPQAIEKHPSLVALAYYGFSNNPSDSMATSPELFRRQVAYLEVQSFGFMNLKHWLPTKSRLSEDRQILITIEGWSSESDSLLQETLDKKIPVVLFLNSLDLKNSEAISFVQRQAQNPLLSVGLRGTGMAKSINEELHQLADLTGSRVSLFSYPVSSDPRPIKVDLQSAGITLALTHLSGAIGSESDPLLWPRFPINNHHGQLLGPQKNGFEIRAFSLPMDLTSLEDKNFLQTNRLFIGITTQIHDARRLNCFFNGSPVARIMRTAQHKHFPASMKNWGHRYELSLKEKPEGPPLLRCTLLAQPGSKSQPPRFHWGTVQLPSAKRD